MEKKKSLFENTFILAVITALVVIISGLIITKIPYYLEIIIVLIVSLTYSLKSKKMANQSEIIIFAISYALFVLVFQILFMTLKASFDVFFLVRLIFSFALLIPTMGKITIIRFISSYGLFFAINRIGYAYLNPQVLKSENINAWFKLHKTKIIIIFSLIVVVSTYIAIPKPNSFTKTGSINAPYGLLNGILLKNGDALILPESNPQTETYNVATGKFTLSGVMKQFRNDYTATLLGNGKVLIVGGDYANLSVADAELYDPTTMQFQYSGKMITPREKHAAVLLPNGNVLVAGGISYTLSTNNKSSWKLLSSAEIYDVKTGKFIPTGNMHYPREYFSAVLLKNGKVLITGGKGEDEKILSSVELYDPKTGIFTLTADMSQPRADHKSLSLHNGNAVLVGGQNFNNAVETAEIFNTRTNLFEKTSLKIGRSAVIFPDGKIFYASGGVEGSFFAPRKLTNISEICDMEKLTCTDVGKLKEYRYSHSEILLDNNKVLVVGGYKNSRTPLTSAELFTYNKKVD